RAAEDGEQDRDEHAGLRQLSEPLKTERDEQSGDADDCDEPNDAVENDGQECAGGFSRRFFEQEIALHDIATGSARKKLIVKHSDQKKSGQTSSAEMNALHLE